MIVGSAFNGDNFLVALLFSFILHLLILCFGIYNFTLNTDFKQDYEQVITFEMLPASNISNIPNLKASPQKNVTTNKISKLEPSNANSEAKQIKTNNNDLSNVNNEAELIKVENKKPLKLQKVPASDNSEKLKVKLDKKIKREIVNNELDSLLKNLKQTSSGSEVLKDKKLASNTDKNNKDSQGEFKDSLPISIQDKDLVIQQISRNWNIPAGSENIAEIKILLYILIGRDGAVIEVKISEKKCGKASNISCQLIADSALRAVRQASPLKGLTPERYDAWKEFYFLFDPSRMIR